MSFDNLYRLYSHYFFLLGIAGKVLSDDHLCQDLKAEEKAELHVLLSEYDLQMESDTLHAHSYC